MLNFELYFIIVKLWYFSQNIKSDRQTDIYFIDTKEVFTDLW